MILATKTLAAINSGLELDQGAKYRGLLKDAMSDIGDAFDSKPDLMPRSHLGASLIGKECARELWYSFHWAVYSRHEGRILRLFNRGHLEEARFIALMRTGGMSTWHQDNGHQFRISGFGGHFGGSLDGVGAGCPDLPVGTFCLLEFKTHSKKNFDALVKIGVEKAQPKHVIQCNQYMGYYKLPWALYCAVCKDNDDLHLELIPYDRMNRESYFERAGAIIAAKTPPPKINHSISWFECKFCDMKDLCYEKRGCEHNCRTCENATPITANKEPTWYCQRFSHSLSKAEQFAGCESWKAIEGMQ